MKKVTEGLFFKGILINMGAAFVQYAGQVNHWLIAPT
jgi:hypothetical protein